MEEIYGLIGRIIHIYQQLEYSIQLILYVEARNPSRNEEYKTQIDDMFNKVYDKTLGQKLCVIKKLDILGSEDNIVLDYMKNKRNYLVHHFFIDNELVNEQNIQMKKQELELLLHDANIVYDAIKMFICKNAF